jgi:GNAT superfamily N-acetyltransferase
MHYRIATEQDVPALARLRWEFDREENETAALVGYDRFVEICGTFLYQGLQQGEWTYWVAEDEGEIVSHVFVSLFHPVPRPGRLQDSYGYMTNVYTRPAYRNQGIGTALMQEVLAWAKSRDLALLIVSPSERAIPFYLRAGFTTECEFMELTLRPDEAPTLNE